MNNILYTKASALFEAHSHLRMLFLFDSKNAFREEFAALKTLEDAGIVCIEVGKAHFGLKYRLETELKEKKVLLYFPHAEPIDSEKEHFHLLDVLVANQQLHISPEADLIAAFQIPRPYHELIYKYYDLEINVGDKKEKKTKAAFYAGIYRNLNETNLLKAMAAYHLGLESPKPTEEALIAALFVRANEASKEGFEQFLQTAQKLSFAPLLCQLVNSFFELEAAELTYQHIQTAAEKLKYNALVHRLPDTDSKDTYALRDKLKVTQTNTQHLFNALLTTWEKHPSISVKPSKVFNQLAVNVEEQSLMEWYGVNAAFGYQTTPIIWAVLTHCMTLIQKGQNAKALESLEASFDQADSNESIIAQFLQHTAACLQIIQAYDGFYFENVSDCLKAYTGELFRADTYYRKAMVAYQQIEVVEGLEETALAGTLQKLEEKYEHHFLTPLNLAWQKTLEEKVFRYTDMGVPLQQDFFKKYIAKSEKKMAVIISDAFRFEVAQELATQLSLEDVRKTTQLDAMVSALPSITAMGMAHLLPRKTPIQIKGENLSIGGIETNGTAKRHAILQSESEEFGTISYKDLWQKSKKEGRDFFKQYRVVFIYHNVIDNRGEQQVSEHETFQATADAVEQLHKLVRKLNGFNILQVGITADHGFIYTNQKIQEFQKNAFPESEKFWHKGQRYFMASAIEAKKEHLVFPLANTTAIEESNMQVALPRGINRFKSSGGYKYIHGGATLQEMVVPMLQIRKARVGKAEKVNIRLLNNKYRITSSAFRLELLQVEALNSSRKALVVDIGFYNDDKELVSQSLRLTFDAASSNPTMRQQSQILSFTRKINSLKSCHLMVFDAEEDLNKLRPIINQKFTVKLISETDF